MNECTSYNRHALTKRGWQNKFSGYEVLLVSEGYKLKVGVTALRYLSWFFGICALVVGVASGLIEVFLAQFVCVDSCPQADTIFPWYLSSALIKLLLPTAALLVLAYLSFAGYCVATAQTRHLLAPTWILVLGAAVSVGAIVWYSRLFVTMIPVDKDGVLINGPAQRWTAGLGQITAGLAFIWASIFYALLLSPDETRRQMPPNATPSEESAE